MCFSIKVNQWHYVCDIISISIGIGSILVFRLTISNSQLPEAISKSTFDFCPFCLVRQKLLDRFHYREIVKLSPMDYGPWTAWLTEGHMIGWEAGRLGSSCFNYFLFPRIASGQWSVFMPLLIWHLDGMEAGCAGSMDHHKLATTLILSFISQNRSRVVGVSSSPGAFMVSSLLQTDPFLICFLFGTNFLIQWGMTVCVCAFVGVQFWGQFSDRCWPFHWLNVTLAELCSQVDN